MIWLVFAAMIAVAVGFASAPLLVRSRRSPQEGEKRARHFARQLTEIEREAENGAISPSEAEALKAEAGRRLIAAGTSIAKPEEETQNPRPAAAIAIAAIVAASGVALYALEGSPQTPSAIRPLAAASDASAAIPAQTNIGSVETMLDGLKSKLAADPENADGWRMLGWSYFNLGRYEESAGAYEKAAALRPDDAALQAAHGEALVMAASGFVTPSALQAFDAALAAGSDDPRARFFKALALDQAGDPKGAIDRWIELANAAPPEADWLNGLVQRINERASETGVDISGRLKARPALSPSRAPSPTPEQMDAAQALPANEQQAMIEGMVARLSARLHDNPDDADGWVRLIKSRMVLGAETDAKRDLSSALAAFAERPEIAAQIAAQASALGVTAD